MQKYWRFIFCRPSFELVNYSQRITNKKGAPEERAPYDGMTFIL